MVPVTALHTTYAIIRKKLNDGIANAPWPSPEAGFLDYLDATGGKPVRMRSLVTDRLEETPILASAGYQYANATFSRPPTYDDEWSRHFCRLAQRQAFPMDRESYFYRPLDLLGICIGAHRCPSLTDDNRKWLQQILRDGEARLSGHLRSHNLGAVAAAQLDITWTMDSTPRVQHLPLALLSLLYWIANQEGLIASTGVNIVPKDLAATVLQKALTEESSYDDLADAGLILHATEEIIERTIRAHVEENWGAPRNRQAAETLVRTICERFNIIANTLLHRHKRRSTLKIQDEYDVQDLLGALLKLHFSDVRPEEWTPSYTGNASRMDYLLKPEQIVVETKMTRKGLGQKEVVTELAEDILRYQSHQDCKTLICFVYDPAGRCSHPTALEHDLSKDHSTLRIIVIVQPKRY